MFWTDTVIVEEVPTFPAASYARAWSVFVPLAAAVVFQANETEALLELVATNAPFKYHSTRLTPTLSVALTFTLTVLETVLPAPGAVIVTSGGVTSGTTFCTVTTTDAAEPMFPAASYARAPRVWEPFVYPVVSHKKIAGALEFVPQDIPSKYHSTRVTPTSSVAVTSMVATPDTVLLVAGAVIVVVGAVVSGGALVPPAVATAACTAFRALTRPQPKPGSQPSVPRSSADCLRMSCT